ncbi:MAG: hypothetical protein JO053_07365 [Acidobacteria bacterium]|nr:hypothetical protein [Acidobacteriota bacterium]
MKNRQKRISWAILSGILLLTISGVLSSFAQSPAEFGGTWNTVTSSGKKIVITLKSTDRRTNVTGTYAVNGLTASYQSPPRAVDPFVRVSFMTGEPPLQSLSSITGTVTGNVLRFKWLEDGGRGAGKFTMSSDGESFEGTFSRTDNPDNTSGGTWNGTRAPNFAGAWQTTSSGRLQFADMVLQQSGIRVTGYLSAGNPSLGMITEGVIDGNTLRFQVLRDVNIMPGRPPQYQYSGTGELVMDKGSRSFKGTILGTPTVGTRLGR